jgi:2,3-bisphosphoglycerate-independent phosphoglycerate mutase
VTDPGEEIRLHSIGGHRAVLTYRKEGFRVPEGALAGFSPPQEIAGETIDGHLPTSEVARRFVHIVNDSQMILATHPEMREKLETTMFAANSLWLWGGGQKASLPPISGVAGGRKVTFIARNPAVLGLGRLGGAETVKISLPRKKAGFPGKSGCAEMREAARKALETSEFVLLYTDDATSAAERGDTAGKIAAIEALDAELLGPLLENPGADPCRILVLSDGIVSTETRRPEPGPTPYAMADWIDGRLAPPPGPRGLVNTLAGLWHNMTGQSRPAGSGEAPPAFSERLCEHAPPLVGVGLLKRLLAA